MNLTKRRAHPVWEDSAPPPPPRYTVLSERKMRGGT